MSSASLHPSATSAGSSVAIKRSLQHQTCPSTSCASGQVTCQLVDADLWRRFHEVGNEMIVTKAGRRMFPVIACTVSGLDPDALYSVCVEFHPADDNRYKYVGGQWVIAAKSQLHDVPVPTYYHPEVPNFGQHWGNNVVSFGKLKLTNKDKLDKSQVSLVTLHLYQPVIRIIRVAGQQERFTVATFTFPETRFMAVTSYQNEDVTSLKVRYNPFAQKVFQDMAKGRSGGSSTGQEEDGDDEPVTLSPPAESRPAKMMKTSSGVALATASSTPYNNRISPRTVQPPSQQQSQLRPCQAPVSSLITGEQNYGADFSSFGFQAPRYGAFTPIQQPPNMFDQLGSTTAINPDCFQFSSMYNNSSYHPIASAASQAFCFSNNPIAPVTATSQSAAAAAAAYASYSSSLLSSTTQSTNGSFWQNFGNLYPPIATNNLSKTSSKDIGLLTPVVPTPSTPPGTNSTPGSSSGGRSSSVSLTQVGTVSSKGASSTTPTLQSLASRSSESTGGNANSTACISQTQGIVKSSPPESGYCGSPVSEEWANYQQLMANSAQVLMPSANSTSAPTSNNATY